MTFKVDVEAVDALRRRLAVEVPAEEVSAEIERTYADLARAAKVRGFRPGHVPRGVLERLFGDRVCAEVYAKLIQHSLSEVIEERQIEALGQPEIVTEQAQPGAALRYSATVEVKPEVVVEHYGGLKVERPLAAVSAADVDASVERLRRAFAQLQPITDRAEAARGDVATLDYEVRAAGRLLSRAEQRDVQIGENGFPAVFDEHLVGAAVGTAVRFPVVYPSDHPNPELAGRTVDFEVRVRALSRQEVPALDDEFAKDHGECATLAELRERIRQRLEQEAAQQADDAVRQRLLAQLLENHEVPVPGTLVRQRTAALLEEVRDDWQRRRVRPRREAEVLAELRTELEPRARQQVKAALLLEAIARREHLEVSDDELGQHVAALAAGAGTAGERVRALYQDAAARRQLRARLLQSRALDLVVTQAQVQTVAAPASVAEAGENR